MAFPTTRRSLVLALSSGDESERARAFDTLAGLYWRPLYKYARFAHSRAPVDAEDLTQGFLVTVFEKETLASYDPQRGGFRPFLRMLFDRYVANEVKAAGRTKRGGGVSRVAFESAESELSAERAAVKTPEELFQSEWARSVFSLALARLREVTRDGDFAMFEACDLDDDARASYAQLAERFSLPVTTVTNRLAATRRRFREIVLEILREATATESEYRSEVRSLLGGEP